MTLSLEDRNVIAWIALVVLALILAIGMSWSHLYQRWSGQATVDEVDETLKAPRVTFAPP